MRRLPAALHERLAAPLSGTIFLWRLLRQDGAAFGFTSHDRPVVKGWPRTCFAAVTLAGSRRPGTSPSTGWICCPATKSMPKTDRPGRWRSPSWSAVCCRSN
ncbi:hypothetical protein B5C34_07065 [Pacificimonas flava]|uniref:Uncharacterized protein n=2 Tax=Pacificimonas TaxID=1960290 RepID=A0A219B4B9_9SPHN|nr:DUF2163 domain-containing protein [Pacificimonas aurantium]OWV33240.1 hypothetical protein B5C34_07065 [Pacificimonas flava]